MSEGKITRVHTPADVFLKLAVKTNKEKGSFADLTKYLHESGFPVSDVTAEQKLTKTPSGLSYTDEGKIVDNNDVEVSTEEIQRRMALPKNDPNRITSGEIGVNMTLVLKGYKPLTNIVGAGSNGVRRSKTAEILDSLADELGLEVLA